MGGEEAVLAHRRRGQREFRRAAGDQVEIRRSLCILGEYLEDYEKTVQQETLNP